MWDLQHQAHKQYLIISILPQENTEVVIFLRDLQNCKGVVASHKCCTTTMKKPRSKIYHMKIVANGFPITR